MIKAIQSPGCLHLKIASNILENVSISFDNAQGYLNAKDLQVQFLVEYEKLRSRGIKRAVKKKTVKTLGWNELTERVQNTHPDMQEIEPESSEEDAESNNEAFYGVDTILYAKG